MFALRRQPLVTVAAPDYLDVELSLEPADTGRKGRLRYVAFRRGAAEVFFLGQRHQVFELTELHLGADQACGYKEYEGKLP